MNPNEDNTPQPSGATIKKRCLRIIYIPTPFSQGHQDPRSRVFTPMSQMSIPKIPEAKMKKRRHMQASCMLVVHDAYPGFLKLSTPKLGGSTHRCPGTPSLILLSKKLPHSITTNIHSASALPVYFAWLTASPLGWIGCCGISTPPPLVLSEFADRASVYTLS